MLIFDSLKTSVSSLKHAKIRSFLTILGIVIGIASVILLISIGTSVQKLILEQIQGIGSNVIFILPGGTRGSRLSPPASAQGVIIKTLAEKDLRSLKEESSILRAAPQSHGQTRVVYGNNDIVATFIGTNEDLFAIRNFGIAKGEALADYDSKASNRVAVLGAEISKTLFGDANPLGKSIRLKNLSFTVKGVLGKEGLGPMGVDNDMLIFVPISVAQKQLLNVDYYSVITLQGNDQYTNEFTAARITSILRQNHRITDPDKDDFTIRTQEDALSLLGDVTSILTLFLTSIAAISLVVGGIGIMNIMLVSVVERTHEIGLRKAVGATNADILQQFLYEAMILTLVGGIIGITLGSSLTVALAVVLSRLLITGWVFALPTSAIFLAAGVSILIGIVFGIYPARKASLLNPIDALRYE